MSQSQRFQIRNKTSILSADPFLWQICIPSLSIHLSMYEIGKDRFGDCEESMFYSFTMQEGWKIAVNRNFSTYIYKILSITRKSENNWHVWVYGFPLCFRYTSLHKIPLGPLPPEAAISKSSTYKTNGVSTTHLYCETICAKNIMHN